MGPSIGLWFVSINFLFTGEDGEQHDHVKGYGVPIMDSTAWTADLHDIARRRALEEFEKEPYKDVEITGVSVQRSRFAPLEMVQP